MYPKLSTKLDLADTARRFEAFFAGDIIGRPVVCVTAPLRYNPASMWDCDSDYYAKVNEKTNELIEKVINIAESTYYGGEALPVFSPSMGPDEIAFYCGGELSWSVNSTGRIFTNWSKPVIMNWEDSFPIQLDESNALWKRLLDFYKKVTKNMEGKVLLSPPDLHTNMDLLSALRGPENLCADLCENPMIIDKAMAYARSVFPLIWEAVSAAGQMKKNGYSNLFYAMDGAAVLQCDFSCMISPSMFRRWVLPALEEEASIVKHAVYHWDGIGALMHTDDLIASKGLHTLCFLPGEGNGKPVDYIELYQKIQAHGKAVEVWGSIEEIKYMHKILKPNKTIYVTNAGSWQEAEALLDWFSANT